MLRADGLQAHEVLSAEDGLAPSEECEGGRVGALGGRLGPRVATAAGGLLALGAHHVEARGVPRALEVPSHRRRPVVARAYKGSVEPELRERIAQPASRGRQRALEQQDPTTLERGLDEEVDAPLGVLFILLVAGLLVAGPLVAGLLVAGLRVAGLRVVGLLIRLIRVAFAEPPPSVACRLPERVAHDGRIEHRIEPPEHRVRIGEGSIGAVAAEAGEGILQHIQLDRNVWIVLPRAGGPLHMLPPHAVDGL